MNHPSSEVLALHAGGDLPTLEAELVNEHLASCELCRVEIRELASSLEAFRTIAVEPAVSEVRALSEAVLQRRPAQKMNWSRIAAAAVILIFAGGGALWLSHRMVPAHEVVAHVTPTQTQNLETKEPTSSAARPAQTPAVRGAGKHAAAQQVRLAAEASAPRVRQAQTPPALKEVSRETETGEPAELQLVSSNPKVVVLWQMTDASAASEGTGTEGKNRP